MVNYRKRESSFTLKSKRSDPSFYRLLCSSTPPNPSITAQPSHIAKSQCCHPSAPMKYPCASMQREGCQRSSQKMLILTSSAPGLAEWGHFLSGDEKNRLSAHPHQDLVWNCDHLVCSSRSTCSTSISLSMPRPADPSLLLAVQDSSIGDLVTD